jgi:hypothetical protein
VAPAPLLAQDARVSRPANITAPRAAKQPDPPQVEVHIGTIEIVSEPPPPQQPAGPASTPRGLSLDEFLDGVAHR